MPIGKQKKNRECPKCHTNSYWKFHLCRNKGCHWYYKIPSAPEDAKKRWKRRLWMRAVEHKGRMQPEIENELAIQREVPGRCPKSEWKVARVYGVIKHIMRKRLRKAKAAPFMNAQRIPKTPSKSCVPWELRPRAPRGSIAKAGLGRPQALTHWQKNVAKQKIRMLAKHAFPEYQPKASPQQVPTMGRRPKWSPKQTFAPKPKLPSVKSGGHFCKGVWVSRNRGQKRRRWPANKKL